jgi:8-oxo-dGTP diphosphatase
MMRTNRNKLYNESMSETRARPSSQTQPPNTGPFLQNLDVRVVVFSLRDERLQVLLVQNEPARHPSPQIERWELPGSRVLAQQSLEETATSCLVCLTGLHEAYLEQLYTYGDAPRQFRSMHRPDAQQQRDPEAKELLQAMEQLEANEPLHGAEERLVTVVYFAIIPAGVAHAHSTSVDQDECQSKWFPVDQLPTLILDYGEVLAYALRRLRYKLEYTAVGFQMLPEQFSLSELQKVYEMILGEKLDKRNFRRRMLQAGIIEETRHLRSGEGRPARLFRYRPDAVAEVKARRLFP